MLSAPRTIGEVAPLGTIGAQARELGAFLRQPGRAAFVGVSLPEEMAVPRQQNTILPVRDLDQRSVIERRVIGRVIPEHAKPPGKAAKHRVGEEFHSCRSASTGSTRAARLAGT